MHFGPNSPGCFGLDFLHVSVLSHFVFSVPTAPGVWRSWFTPRFSSESCCISVPIHRGGFGSDLLCVLVLTRVGISVPDHLGLLVPTYSVFQCQVTLNFSSDSPGVLWSRLAQCLSSESLCSLILNSPLPAPMVFWS